MARRRYKPFRSRNTKNRKYVYLFAVVILVIIAVFVLKMVRKDSQPPMAGPSPDDAIIQPEPIEPEETEPRAVVSLEPEEPEQSEPQAETPIVAQEPIEQEKTPEPIVETPIVQQTAADKGESPVINPEANALIVSAKQDLDNDRVISARNKLNDVLSMDISSSDRVKVKRILARLSEKWLFSKVYYPEDTLTSQYKVQPGDLLSEIGRDNKVPYEIIMKINGISRPELLQAGKTIKVVHGPFHAIIHRSTFEMDIILGKDTYVKTYKIGLGSEGKETPTGRWRVKTNGKLVRPPWPRPQELGGGLIHPDDPEYPLGSRWVGLNGLEGDAKGRKGFGIHGTKDPETIGTQSSLGCVRLHNGDAIEVYDMMTPGQSEVLIVE